ncbi:hypothetical protein K438DRAFT_1939352 [Mycena galopus ATCC 62051]|nr:hypothetical protein K438DRAFT_1939352 [Mycena galopus ATCC 62051]
MLEVVKVWSRVREGKQRHHASPQRDPTLHTVPLLMPWLQRPCLHHHAMLDRAQPPKHPARRDPHHASRCWLSAIDAEMTLRREGRLDVERGAGQGEEGEVQQSRHWDIGGPERCDGIGGGGSHRLGTVALCTVHELMGARTENRDGNPPYCLYCMLYAAHFSRWYRRRARAPRYVELAGRHIYLVVVFLSKSRSKPKPSRSLGRNFVWIVHVSEDEDADDSGDASESRCFPINVQAAGLEQVEEVVIAYVAVAEKPPRERRSAVAHPRPRGAASLLQYEVRIGCRRSPRRVQQAARSLPQVATESGRGGLKDFTTWLLRFAHFRRAGHPFASVGGNTELSDCPQTASSAAT